MAIYHCSVKVISRSKGRSATGAAAYRAGERIDDRRTGLSHDYTKKQGVSHCEILAPSGAPAWAYDREELWNRVEEIEKRKDAQVAREVEIALPQELDFDQQKALATAYVREQFVQHGMVADICIHHADQENPHAHVMLTMRDIDQEGFGKKRRDWNDKALLEQWREAWSQHANAALTQAGTDARIDHRSLETQGIDRVATIKMGQAACAMEKRGITTERGDINRSTKAANDVQQELAGLRVELKSARSLGQVIQQVQDDPESQSNQRLEQISREWHQLKSRHMAAVSERIEPIQQRLERQIKQQQQRITHHEAQKPEPPRLLAGLRRQQYQKRHEGWASVREALQGRLAQLRERWQRFVSHMAIDRLAEQRAEREQPGLRNASTCAQAVQRGRNERAQAEKQARQAEYRQQRLQEAEAIKTARIDQERQARAEWTPSHDCREVSAEKLARHARKYADGENYRLMWRSSSIKDSSRDLYMALHDDPGQFEQVRQRLEDSPRMREQFAADAQWVQEFVTRERDGSADAMDLSPDPRPDVPAQEKAAPLQATPVQATPALDPVPDSGPERDKPQPALRRPRRMR